MKATQKGNLGNPHKLPAGKLKEPPSKETKKTKKSMACHLLVVWIGGLVASGGFPYPHVK